MDQETTIGGIAISEDLKRAFKGKCAQNGQTMTEVLVAFCWLYVNGVTPEWVQEQVSGPRAQ